MFNTVEDFNQKLFLPGTLFTIGPLNNSTTYHVRVRTRNAAGNSEWLDSVDAKTTDDAIRLTATFILIIAAILALLY